MNIIQSGRKTGKTARLVAEVKNTPGAMIVVSDVLERKRLIDHWDVRPSQVTTLHSALHGSLAGRARDLPIYVDNLDRVLAELFGGRHVTAAALGSDSAASPEEPTQ